MIGEETDDIEIFHEYIWVCPVNVPLPFVKCGPDPGLHLLIEGEITWRKGWKDFRMCLLDLIWDGSISKGIEVVPVFLFSRLSLLRPFVFGRYVI